MAKQLKIDEYVTAGAAEAADGEEGECHGSAAV